MNSIEDIGLAYAIGAYEAVHLAGKVKGLILVVFEIGEVDRSEKQNVINEGQK